MIETADENQRKDLAIVLVNPQIPGNTGTIARTCAATRVPLHLVGPLGFELTDSQLKRAGLDYWQGERARGHGGVWGGGQGITKNPKIPSKQKNATRIP